MIIPDKYLMAFERSTNMFYDVWMYYKHLIFDNIEQCVVRKRGVHIKIHLGKLFSLQVDFYQDYKRLINYYIKSIIANIQ